MMTCATCGWMTSAFLVAMSDHCPRCKTSPFVENPAQDPERNFVEAVIPRA